MRIGFLLGIFFLGLAGCEGAGPVYKVQPELYEWVVPDAIDPRSDRAPVIADSEVKFSLNRGARRSSLLHDPNWTVGTTRLVGFDIKADARTLPYRPIAVSKIVRWTAPKTDIATVYLDRRRGVSVFGKTCIAAKDLNEWHRVELRVKFANDDSGYLEVFCDRQPLLAFNDIRTTFPPECRRADGCNQPVAVPTRYQWEVGLMSDHPVWQNVDIVMKRLHERFLIVVPNRI